MYICTNKKEWKKTGEEEKNEEVEGWRTSVWQLLRDQDAGKIAEAPKS